MHDDEVFMMFLQYW